MANVLLRIHKADRWPRFSVWAVLGAKTIELVHQNINVDSVRDEMVILELEADIIDDFLECKKDAKKAAQKIEINFVARIIKHGNDPRLIKLGERLEELREKHEMGVNRMH